MHAGPHGRTLVVALLLHGGGSGATLQDDVLARLPVECGAEEQVPRADLAAALPGDLATYRYGSTARSRRPPWTASGNCSPTVTPARCSR